MAEDEKPKGISAERAGLGLLTGLLGSYLFPTVTLAGRVAWSVAYSGIAAIVNKLFNGKEKTTPATSLAEGVAHFGGRTLGDYIRDGLYNAPYYAPRLLY